MPLAAGCRGLAWSGPPSSGKETASSPLLTTGVSEGLIVRVVGYGLAGSFLE